MGVGPGLREALPEQPHAWLVNFSKHVVFRGWSPDYGRSDHKLRSVNFQSLASQRP